MPATYSKLLYHFVFATKQRKPIITDRPRLYAYTAGTIQGLGGTPISIGGTDDHVHMFTGLKTTHCIADFMRELKKATSAWFHQELKQRDFTWQEGYGAFTVGQQDATALVSYIQDQIEHHKTETASDELLRLCREAGLEVDMRFFE
jgi:REP element-mobilizing transposase RayT